MSARFVVLARNVALACGTTLLIAAGLAGAGPAGSQPRLQAGKADAPPVIDGDLSDPCWATAGKVDAFYNQLSPSTPASERTCAYVCTDKGHLYFAFEAFDRQPEKIVATQTKRGGKLESDDTVFVVLDPFFYYRQTCLLMVNPLGTQADEGLGEGSSKIEWRGDWSAAARITDEGYTVEMAIPFSVLSYPAAATEINLVMGRVVARAKEVALWPQPQPAIPVDNFGVLEGLEMPPQPFLPTYLGVSTLRWQKGGPSLGLKSELSARAPMGGGGARLLLNVNPDFSDVEQEVQTIAFSYTERFLEDSRTFFAEGQEYFPEEYFYSRRIPGFDMGIKAFGELGGLRLGYLSTHDFGLRNDYVLRLGQEQPIGGSLLRYSVTGVAREGSGVHHMLTSVSASAGMGGYFVYAIGARTQNRGPGGDGGDAEYGVGYSSERLYVMVDAQSVGQQFLPIDGYAPEVGISRLFAMARLELNSPERNLVRQEYRTTWGRGTAHSDGSLYSRYAYTQGEFALRNGTGFELSYMNQYRLGDWNHVWGGGLLLRGNDPYRATSVAVQTGRLANADDTFIAFTQGLNPSQNLYFRLSSQYHRRREDAGGLVKQTQNILHVNYDVTPERTLGLRLLEQSGDYNLTLSYRQALRRGLDMYIVFGDPYARQTVTRIGWKVMRTF